MDPIIKLRLETLKANLTKLPGILKSVRERQAEINKLSKKLTDAQQYLKTVGFNVVTVTDNAKNPYSQAKIDASLNKYLLLAQEAIPLLEQTLEDVLADLDAIGTRWNLIEESFERTFEEDLKDRMKPWFETIEKNLTSLKKAGQENSDPLMQAAWHDFGTITSQQAQLLSFSEYVEFLGGLALRYAGLDEGICRIADELMRSCGAVGKTKWAALTIPASHEAVTLARSIRLRFPEWTIWAVPLTAHELGKVVIDGSDKLKKYVEAQSPGNTKKAKKGKQELRVYLADAFATYVMGPAYAYSLILLRLNPMTAYQEEGMYPADDLRAHVVLTMLTKMLEKDLNVNPPYGEVLEKVKEAWENALAQVKGKAPENLNEEKKQVEVWTDYLFKELISENEKGLYDGRFWLSTKEALEKLLSGGNAKDKLKGGEGWRDVLNAAWSCRVNNMDDYQKIAQKAEELWRLIEEKSKESSQDRVTRLGVAGNVPPNLTGGRN